MRLNKLHIQNFRKLNNVDILMGDATFLIGANNSGKSSALDAIEYLTSDKNKLDDSCRSRFIDDNGEERTNTEDVIIEGEFCDVPIDILNERGFKPERLIVTKDNEGNETYSFKYRVRLSSDNKTNREMLMHTTVISPKYSGCKTYQDFIDKGADSDLFEGKNLSKKLSSKEIDELNEIAPSLFDILNEEEWFSNPGGIPGNVLSKLPIFLKIKADVLIDEMAAEKSGTLHDLLDILFNQVRDSSPNYKNAVAALRELEKEMNPEDPDTEFGKLMKELNDVVDSVFHNASITVATELTKPDNLKAKYSASLTSNIKTPVERQGTGLIRATVFALLRYNKQRQERQDCTAQRGTIIGFEEPELFLHPNAAEKMRDIIYELASSSNQIIATTHSPYMIDLSKSNRQVLNSFKTSNYDYSSVFPFNLSDAFQKIVADDRTRVKMLQKIDSYVSRVFFAQKAIIIEGDTEDIVLKHTINILPEDIRKAIKEKYQIIKATGKATMISFIRYLSAIGINLFVIHDEDSDTPGAFKMNDPILKALGNDSSKRIMMHNCIEDELGYDAPNSDKPFKAYSFVDKWKCWNDVPKNWKDKIRIIFSEFELPQ